MPHFCRADLPTAIPVKDFEAFDEAIVVASTNFRLLIVVNGNEFLKCYPLLTYEKKRGQHVHKMIITTTISCKIVGTLGKNQTIGLNFSFPLCQCWSDVK